MGKLRIYLDTPRGVSTCSTAIACVGGDLGGVLVMGKLRFYSDTPRGVSTCSTAIACVGGDWGGVLVLGFVQPRKAGAA